MQKLSISVPARYVLGKTRFIDCEDQGMLNIRDLDECKAACDALGIPIGKLVNGRICFKAGKGKCTQENTAGAKTSRICKNEGRIWFCMHPID